ncbi:hypothetical protein CQW23_15254 [Capsicum baccatum]|uniref:HAT C-terminal dimerisation domain-containing protein n=1 Tax=Capsicum baccatum TaxID=33114 RepID=A0A2G2WLI5_CAPBA|nr:hypothetical protein CQW23_15254 [Capsicum baccatum]
MNNYDGLVECSNDLDVKDMLFSCKMHKEKPIEIFTLSKNYDIFEDPSLKENNYRDNVSEEVNEAVKEHEPTNATGSGLACDFVVGCYYFTHLGCTSSSFRSSLTSKLVEALVCLQDWLRSESQPISIEEDLDSLEQLEQGYFAVDKDSTSEKVVFNRTVTLRDNYAKGGKSQYSEFLLKSQY